MVFLMSDGFTPGLIQQDIWTLPIEALSIAAINAAYKPHEPLWPFTNESNNGVRRPTRHPKLFLVEIALPTTLTMFSYSFYREPDLPVYSFIAGLAHAHLLTEVVTSFGKIVIQRHRPFYDTEKVKGLTNNDDRFSFMSGHTSHAFALATYMGEFMRTTSPSAIGWASTVLLYTGAGWIGAARAIDGQHHWSDVAWSAAAGTLIAHYVFVKTESSAKISQQQSSGAKVELNLALEPSSGCWGIKFDSRF